MIDYLIIVNVVAFIICYIDKYRAIKNKWRIPESVLLFISFIGGCLGFLLGMILFHHKTKKLKFKIFIPLFILMWFVIIIEKFL